MSRVFALTLFVGLLTVSGCTTVNHYTTPTAIRANPASTAQFVSAMSFDDAYKKTVEQMRACFERKAKYLQYTVTETKSPNEAEVTWGLSTALSYKVLSTIVLRPIDTRSRVELYSAFPTQPDSLYTSLQSWLINNGTGCPGDSAK